MASSDISLDSLVFSDQIAAPMTPRLSTAISTFDSSGATIRGKNLANDLIGEVSFTQMIYFYILGEMPTSGQAAILDAVLVTLMDHGMLGGATARQTYRGAPDSIQGAVAAGLLSLGSQYGGVMEQVGAMFDRLLGADDLDAAARELVREYRAAKKPLPGFGHNDFRPDDPRTPKLLKVAEAQQIDGRYITALRALSRAVDAAVGKHVTINATAAIAALLAEIGVPPRIMRGFAVISRTPGLVGQLYEEQTNPIANALLRLAHDHVVYIGGRSDPRQEPHSPSET